MRLRHSRKNTTVEGFLRTGAWWGSGGNLNGEALDSEYDGTSFDYSRKGGIVHTEILLPDHAPLEFSDRNTLWNAVEKIEKSKNAQLVREVELSLPRELTREQNIALARRYVQENFVNAGMVADLCFHEKDPANPHIHIMLTMRRSTRTGRGVGWGDKQRKEYILGRQRRENLRPE